MQWFWYLFSCCFWSTSWTFYCCYWYENYKALIKYLSGAAERILDWVGSKNFLGTNFSFFAQIFFPKRGFPQILGRQLPTLPTRVRGPCKLLWGWFKWFKIVKNKKNPWAILKILGNAHSPFCPDLADFSACVPPALQNGPGNFFVFCNFESLLTSLYNKLWSQNLLHFFFFWATLANLGGDVFTLH